MKFRFIVILVILLLSISFSSANSKDNPVVAGGYEKIAIDDQAVKDCVKYLEQYLPTETQYKNLKIKEVKEAYSQVVAGRNIKLMCTVENNVNNKIKEETWEFIVYINLNNEYKATSCKKYETVIPGGYKTISIDDKDVKDCVKYLKKYFPAETQYKNIKIKEVKEAYYQVVAGRNIKLICTVENNVNNKITEETWEFIVYINLDNVYKVTSCKNIK